jgi:hypothetical protein
MNTLRPGTEGAGAVVLDEGDLGGSGLGGDGPDGPDGIEVAGGTGCLRSRKETIAQVPKNPSTDAMENGSQNTPSHWGSPLVVSIAARERNTDAIPTAGLSAPALTKACAIPAAALLLGIQGMDATLCRLL